MTFSLSHGADQGATDANGDRINRHVSIGKGGCFLVEKQAGTAPVGTTPSFLNDAGFVLGRFSSNSVDVLQEFWHPRRSMRDVTSSNFGLLIAYLIPGFTALLGVAFFSKTVRLWLASTPSDNPTIGGFLYITLASVTAGMTASTVRWATIDVIHHHTGIRRPTWDFSRLRDNVAAFDVLNEIHYRYYQFYANTVVAILFTYVASRVSRSWVIIPFGWYDATIVVLVSVFIAGSRDTLCKYYERVADLLAPA